MVKTANKLTINAVESVKELCGLDEDDLIIQGSTVMTTQNVLFDICEKFRESHMQYAMFLYYCGVIINSEQIEDFENIANHVEAICHNFLHSLEELSNKYKKDLESIKIIEYALYMTLFMRIKILAFGFGMCENCREERFRELLPALTDHAAKGNTKLYRIIAMIMHVCGYVDHALDLYEFLYIKYKLTRDAENIMYTQMAMQCELDKLLAITSEVGTVDASLVKGEILLETEDYEEAEKSLREALDIWEVQNKFRFKDFVSMYTILDNLESCLHLQDKCEEAREYEEQRLKMIDDIKKETGDFYTIATSLGIKSDSTLNIADAFIQGYYEGVDE